MTARRRNPKGGASAGFYRSGNVPSRSLTETEWNRIADALGCDTSNLRVRGGRPIRDAIDFAINATAAALIEVPKLPTAREVAPNVAAQAHEILGIAEVLRDAASATRDALDRLDAIRVCDGNVLVAEDDAPVLRLQRLEVPRIASAAEALFLAAASAKAVALQTMREAERLDRSGRGDAQEPTEIHRLLFSLVGFMKDAGLDSRIPTLGDHDMANDFSLFRVARMAIALACNRAGLQNHNSVKWADSTLLKHLLSVRETNCVTPND